MVYTPRYLKLDALSIVVLWIYGYALIFRFFVSSINLSFLKLILVTVEIYFLNYTLQVSKVFLKYDYVFCISNVIYYLSLVPVKVGDYC